jgi:hypothetical protein
MGASFLDRDRFMMMHQSMLCAEISSRHCERSEAIHSSPAAAWIASLRSQ